MKLVLDEIGIETKVVMDEIGFGMKVVLDWDETVLGMKLVLDEIGIEIKVVLDEIVTFGMKVVLDELVFYRLACVDECGRTRSRDLDLSSLLEELSVHLRVVVQLMVMKD